MPFSLDSVKFLPKFPTWIKLIQVAFLSFSDTSPNFIKLGAIVIVVAGYIKS